MSEILNRMAFHSTIADTTSTSSVTETKVFKGKTTVVDVEECSVEVTTAIVGTSEGGVIGLYKGSTEIGTCQLTNGDAVGTVRFFTKATGITGPVTILATDSIKMKVKTASAGGTPAGVCRGTLAYKQN